FKFLGDGQTWVTVVRHKIGGQIGSALSSSRTYLRICQALLQKGKMDTLIEKAQEIGVQEIWPIETRRTVARMNNEKSSQALLRWQRIARESAKQSGSLRLAKIALPRNFEEVLKDIPGSEQVVIFHPAVDALVFRDWIKKLEENKEEKTQQVLNLFFGPEGGFSQEEIRKAVKLRESFQEPTKIVSLGKNIMRSDTAFLGVIASLRLLLGE
ncbi:MAG: RsmE family RNA methyltransferase, partial [Candidatus Omnitrophica bacterium]|nr:RsmE family RNA methyltransferase [Candidatus Omnitrophota bacterium]